MHRRHIKGRQLVPIFCSLILQKVHRRSGSTRRHCKSSSKREKNNNSDDFMPPLEQKRPEGFSQPTLSSRMREQLTDKPAKQQKMKTPFLPAGNQVRRITEGVLSYLESFMIKVSNPTTTFPFFR